MSVRARLGRLQRPHRPPTCPCRLMAPRIVFRDESDGSPPAPCPWCGHVLERVEFTIRIAPDDPQDGRWV